MHFSHTLRLLPFVLALSGSICAQQTGNATTVRRLIRFKGSYHGTGNPAQTTVVSAAFSIYREQRSGTPLWREIQNVQLDEVGNYTILLGSATSEGLPLDLFTTIELRWIEVEIDQVKQPRILLGSVPYALKPVDEATPLGNTAPSSPKANGLGNTASEGGTVPSATGYDNIALGKRAGFNATGNSNIMIGNEGFPADDHVVRIGDVQMRTFIAGISGVNISGVPVLVSHSRQLGIASSSRRFKEDIRDMGDDSQRLLRLRPVTYRYKQPFDDGTKPLQFGLIAEEVAEVYPELVARSADGQIETVRYQVLGSMLLNEVQRLHAQTTEQQEKIHSLEQRLLRLEHLMEGSAARADSPQPTDELAIDVRR